LRVTPSTGCGLLTTPLRLRVEIIQRHDILATPSRGVNYNLTIEVGGMLMTGRRCALLKDSSIERLPTDLVGQIYKPVELQKPSTVEAPVRNART